jgi:hypothetical protein
MSNPLGHAGRMKINESVRLAGSRLTFFGARQQFIAAFGKVRRVTISVDRHELINGTTTAGIFPPETPMSNRQ